MKLRIMKSSGNEWYRNSIGKEFIVHSESKKGGKGKYVVRLNKEDRHLMNGSVYGWVDMKHCLVLKAYGLETQQIIIDDIKEK